MKKVKSGSTYYLVSVRPRFRMPAELVGKFKSKGYKWVQREAWMLEKTDCLNLANEREFLKSFGEQRWEITIQPHVGRYTQRCKTPTCDNSVTAVFYDPLLVSGLQIGRCLKCKSYTLRLENIETNERFEQWEKQAEEATDVFLEMLRAAR